MTALSQAHRILFIRTDRFGDLLMNLPAIHVLRQTYPKAWITLMANASVAELLKDHPDLDEILPVDTELLDKSPSKKYRLFREIRRAKFDLAVVSNPNKFFHAMVYFAGIRHRVGYKRKWGFFLTQTVLDDKQACARHEIDSNLRLVHLVALGEWDGEALLKPNQSSMDAARALQKKYFSPEDRVIAFHTGTSRKEKRWSLENFGKLIEIVRSEGYRVVLVGDSSEKENAVRLVKTAGGGLIDLTGETTLQTLTAFFTLPSIAALVSADSGPVHAAWMSGTPTVALYAKNVPGSDPARWGPRDGRSEVLFKPMNEITVQEVHQSLLKVLIRGKRSA